MQRFELCAECEETNLCSYAYDADEVDSEILKLKTKIKKLKVENERLNAEKVSHKH